jgi:hypothetical protein
MKNKNFLLLTSIFLHAILVNFPTEAIEAKHCDQSRCLLPTCRCSNLDIPGGIHVRDAPQFVLLTFDDAVTQINSDFYKLAFDNRTNPDGCPVAATYFLSHEYTDYSKVSARTIFLNCFQIVQIIKDELKMKRRKKKQPKLVLLLLLLEIEVFPRFQFQWSSFQKKLF